MGLTLIVSSVAVLSASDALDLVDVVSVLSSGVVPWCVSTMVGSSFLLVDGSSVSVFVAAFAKRWAMSMALWAMSIAFVLSLLSIELSC